MAKYYLTVGNRLEHSRYKDCESDHIEVAEHECETLFTELTGEESGRPEYGSMGMMVRVMEEEGHCVYAAYQKGKPW